MRRAAVIASVMVVGFAAATSGCGRSTPLARAPSPDGSLARFVDRPHQLSFSYPRTWEVAPAFAPLAQAANRLVVVSSARLTTGCERGIGTSPCAQPGATTATWGQVGGAPPLPGRGRHATHIDGYHAELFRNTSTAGGHCPAREQGITAFIDVGRASRVAMWACVPLADPTAQHAVVAMLRSFRPVTTTGE